MAGTAPSMLVDYYVILCVARTASTEEICAAFVQRAMNWRLEEHFDKETAIFMFQLIQQAYKVLSDPRRRAMFDAGIYDPTLDKEEPKFVQSNVFRQVMSAITRDQEQQEERWGVIADQFINLKQQAPNSNSSSSSAAPVVRVDVTFNNDDGSSSTTTTESGSSSRTTSRRATPRRRVYQHPIFKDDLKFPDRS